jgi:hypothetical protein
MVTDFYITFSALCFTLLGLWLVVVTTRLADWRGDTALKRRAYGISLHFSLPGLMSLFPLIDPASTALWRISFAVIAGSGAIVLALVRGAVPARTGQAAFLAAVILYALIAVLAAFPGIVTGLGMTVAPLRIEAVLLTILVFLGVNVAWLLLFDHTSPTAHSTSTP